MRWVVHLHSGITLRDMMTMAGVNDTDELINWIENHKKYISKARFMK